MGTPNDGVLIICCMLIAFDAWNECLEVIPPCSCKLLVRESVNAVSI